MKNNSNQGTVLGSDCHTRKDYTIGKNISFLNYDEKNELINSKGISNAFSNLCDNISCSVKNIIEKIKKKL